MTVSYSGHHRHDFVSIIRLITVTFVTLMIKLNEDKGAKMRTWIQEIKA